MVRWRRIEGPADQVYRLLQEESQALPASANRLASDAEADEAWWTRHCQSQANAALAVARELVLEGERHVSEGHDELAERLFRRALGKLREAVLWEPHQVEHRTHLHTLGEHIHDRFGCELEYRDRSYWVNCPVLLSHSRGGFSVGGRGRSICSVCGEEILNCPHVKGRAYDGTTARKINGELCNICMLSALPEEERDRFEYGKTTVRCHHCEICNGVRRVGATRISFGGSLTLV